MKKILITLTLIFTLCLTAFTLTACKECEHTSKEEKMVVEATCTQNGFKRIVCSDCGKILEEQPVEKLNHIEGAWETLINATCNDKGMKKQACTACGVILKVEMIDIDTTTHNYIYGECELCGAIDETYMTKGLQFKLIKNDTEYEVSSGTVDFSVEEIIIPNIYRGKPVTSIADEAFTFRIHLQSVQISNTVVSIGKRAFSNSLLTSIIIPNSVKEIGYGAFENTGLTSIIIPNSVTSLGGGAFFNCYALESVVLSNKINAIQEGLFSGCFRLEEIEIPNGVVSIGDSAFFECIALKEIIIPKGVTMIGDGAFYDCISFESIIIPESVTSMGSYVLYNSHGTSSLKTIYCGAKSKPTGWDSNWKGNVSAYVLWGSVS